MKRKMRFWEISLALLLLYIGLKSVIGAYGLLFQNGLGIPVSVLSGSPFDSFFIPGIILGVIIGGTHLIASVLLLKKHRYALEASATAGFGLLIWLFVELYIMHKGHTIQLLYFAFGIINLVSVLIMVDKRKRIG